ncbi:MAG: cache domain-containing protein [Methylobacter sp.]|uniref:cache domain-containing protein n=1 Tax=Methylobacter sp. TaxID=2051955 RepID=UPI0027312E6B|nr:cache domain-containing protein [Methylobacter sp.]MDP1666287.1 cache domain-containing protein [Methylobacter sp.]
MTTIKKSKSKSLFNLIIVFISFFVVVVSSYQCWKTDKETLEQTKIAINTEVDISVSDINNRLLYIMKTGQDFADGLTSGEIPYTDFEQHARQIMVINHDNTTAKPSKFYNLSVSFAKGAYDSNQPNQLANVIYVSDRKTGEITLLKRDYDYTINDNSTKTAWFIKAVQERKAYWQQPKYGDISNSFLVSYTTPFFTSASKEKVAGVVSVGFSTDELKTIMDKQDYRRTGFGIILSDAGSLIYHPNDLLPLIDVGNYKEGFKDDLEFINKIRNNIKESQAIKTYELPKTHEKAWVLSKTIPASQWTYQVVFLESELDIEQKILGIKIYLITSLIVFFIALCSYFLISPNKKTVNLWFFSTFVGMIFLVGTAFLWHNADIKEMELVDDVKKINSNQDIHTYKQSQNDFFTAIHKKPPFYIPTGVFINGTEFQGSNNIMVSGYIWQKYQLDDALEPNMMPNDFCTLSSDKIPKDKNIVLSDAFEAGENTTLTCDQSSYTQAKDRIVTLGWYFKVQLRQPFNYSNFPLDKNTIWLRMRPSSLTDYIVLTPDFSSYSNIYERSLMGINLSQFILPSWEIFGTFFSVQTSDLNSNFGINNHTQQTPQELLFNIAIKRVFLDSIFSTVVPICLIYLILFVVLFSSLDDLLAVLGINAGLLFSVALWHSGLRTSLSSTGVTYFETYYFVCYFIISLVCINSVLLACRYELSILHYRNNLLPKLTFFPLVSGITFVITLFMLFN